jgi:transcriptional regulator with XRE-family HTH domain
MIFAQKKLKVLREKKGLTQEVLAKELCTTPASISRLERGLHHARINTIEWYLEAVGYKLTVTEISHVNTNKETR